jgi:hypothetical protein
MLSCWVASRTRIRYGLGLTVGALYLLMNAVHVLVPSQGEIYETVGLFSARRIPLEGLVDSAEEQQAVSSLKRPTVSHGLFTLALTHDQSTTWLFDGVGPWFKLKLPGPFRRYSPHRTLAQHLSGN